MIYFYLFSIVVLAMGISLWTPGGIMLLDYIISDTPYIAWYRPLGNMMTHILGGILGYEWGSKLVVFSILLAAGYLGMLYARLLAQHLDIRARYKIVMIEVLAIVFFVSNPFAYERMLTQPLIYAGVIALGYGWYFLMYQRGYWQAGLAYGAALALFPHASYMILLMVLVYSIGYIRDRRGVYGILYLLGITLLININWILGGAGQGQGIVHQIGFSRDNFLAFETQALAPMGLMMTNMLLHGFWGEAYANHFARTDIMSPYWYIAGIALLLVSLGGWIGVYISGQRKVTLLTIVLISLAIVFALGDASAYTRGLSEWMRTYIPLWSGYREPQKWTGVVMVFFGIGYIWALGWIYKHWVHDRWSGMAVWIVTVMLIYIWSPGVWGGYRGQMRTTTIPEGVISVREVLRTSGGEDSSRILVLPWHAYIGCKWIDRPTIANPIGSWYRGLPMILPDRIETGDELYANTEGRAIDEFLGTGDPLYLEEGDIGYIIYLQGCTDVDDHKSLLDTLLGADILSIVYEDGDVILYAVENKEKTQQKVQ